jgi:methanethiol oxidase
MSAAGASGRSIRIMDPFRFGTGPSVEQFAYVGLVAENPGQSDSIGVVDTTPQSASFAQGVGRVELPHRENRLLRFGWNTCGPRGCRHTPCLSEERRYLVVPGAASSRMHVVDTKPDPRAPRLVNVIDQADEPRRVGHCVPEHFAHDIAWHVGHGALITSESGRLDLLEGGAGSRLLADGGHGCWLQVWDVRTHTQRQAIDLGHDQRMILRLHTAHNPTRAYGFASVMFSLVDLSASVFLWYLGREADGGRGQWKAQRVITIRARPGDPARLPPLLRKRGVVPPLITDISLSPDDQSLYVSCWGTGELRRYDVADPFNPVLAGVVGIGGIVRCTAHPRTPAVPRNGGPQMIEMSRDGRRVYITNALHTAWDRQFYPDGIRGWMAKVDARASGGMALAPDFFVEFENGIRPHQVRLHAVDSASR